MTASTHLDSPLSSAHRALRRWLWPLCVAACATWLAPNASIVLGAESPSLVVPPSGGSSAPNADFTLGDRQPTGWTLEGNGRWVDRQLLEVTGSGQDSSFWRCDAYRFEAARMYRFRTRVRRVSGSGMAITGPSFANRDQAGLSSQWQWVGHVFRVPDGGDAGGYLRLGQWQATGAIQFDQVSVTPVVPVHLAEAGFVLGEGETVRDGVYTFSGRFDHEGSNFHRPLAGASAWFNSDRWTLGAGSQITYAFGLPEHNFASGSVEVHVNYHSYGRCVIEISRDEQSWSPLAAQAEVGTITADVPPELLPAPRLWLRLRGEDGRTSLQVNRVLFTGRLSGTAADASGETVYADLNECTGPLDMETMQRRRDEATGGELLQVRVRNGSPRPLQVRLAVGADAVGSGSAAQDVAQEVAPGQSCLVQAPLPPLRAGEQTVEFRVGASDEAAIQGQMTIRVPDFYRTDYGQRIAGVEGDTAVWWCPATHKVARRRAPPDEHCAAVRIEAARHDWEAAQVVVRPAQPLRGLTAVASDLRGPNGAVIPADKIKLLYVYYHFVHQPTDSTGVRDWWPDALPPLEQGLDVAAHENQPLWVLAYVPPDAVPGEYRGQIALRAEGFAAEVPLQLRVWDFILPQRGNLETAFGLSPGEIFRYHGLKTEADKRQVLDLYFQSFAEHRISPYDPAPLDPIRVQFLPQEEPPRAVVDFEAFDRAMSETQAKYHFNTFNVRLQGMGGGTFHERHPPRIGEFGEDTPQYQAMFASYLSQLEAHFRQRSWLEMAYVYWFDEPEPRDFEFVAQGMRRLQRLAPGLQRMLTEEPGDNVLADLVDIWCPISFHYDHAEAEKRRAAGNRFWWYVCTGPKAPYCTLFIDHPASELRVWHWQTWQRNIVGTLVWQTNYWTSSAAFPDEPQNPYEDPMGYVSGYSTPRGVKLFWGNGDGRFLYPPLAAAVPGRSGDAPVIAPPVSSIRWEMLREGVEDYEFLFLLRQTLQQRRSALSPEELRRFEALLDVPAEITADMTTFTTDPTPIYRHRRAVAEAIERLNGAED